MSKSGHQQSVILYLSRVESATKEEIYNNSTMYYYCNWQKHCGDVLSRMVKNGMIKRVKRGVYAIDDTYLRKVAENTNQIKLF